MKIGITTFYNYNYGSALQCYALQNYIEKHYCSCEILALKSEYGILRRLGKMALNLGKLCLKSPESSSEIIQHFFSQRSNSLTIHKDSLLEIQRFIRFSLNKKEYSWNELLDIGNSDEHILFITGSDQVWNGNLIDNQDFYFLRFAPQHKRVAYAPSFGGDTVSKYNEKLYRKYINEFHHLSARENSGKDIIYNYTQKKADVLADPVCLMDAKQWRECVKENSHDFRKHYMLNDPYILAFFINKPSELAINALDNLQKQTKMPIVSFGYKYNELQHLSDYRHINGSPWDFLQMIDHANVVLTDSFHATVFSIIFETPFYTYKRCYKHKQNQSVRILELLNNVGLNDQFEVAEPNACIKLDFTKGYGYFEYIRKQSYDYFERVLGNSKTTDEVKGFVPFRNKGFCCGCSVCQEICPVNAITMTADEKGAIYPKIDNDKCILCYKCQQYCSSKLPDLPLYNKKIFFGYNINHAQEQKSSSGGVFSALATNVLEKGGHIYGAAWCYTIKGLSVNHICVTKKQDLYKIQGSKYTQSRTDNIWEEIKNKLDNGMLILFSGTSCQIASLKKYLKKDYQTLYTVDLVCHGVIGETVFQDYVSYLENKNLIKINEFSFRRKDCDTPYVVTVKGKKNNGDSKEIVEKLKDSVYFRLFMWREGYRESCYNCQYASMNKPADVTLGDYYPNEEELQQMNGNQRQYYSFIMCNSIKGEQLIEQSEKLIKLAKIDVNRAMERHFNLCHASFPIKPKAWNIYKKKGFSSLKRYIIFRDMVLFVPKKILTYLKQ